MVITHLSAKSLELWTIFSLCGDVTGRLLKDYTTLKKNSSSQSGSRLAIVDCYKKFDTKPKRYTVCFSKR